MYLSGVIHDSRPSLLTAFLCHFSPSHSLSLFILTAGLSERAWTQSTNISDAACGRGVSQHPPIPPCSACLISLCVCVFKCVSLTICFSLPLVLLTCLSFQEKLIFFTAFFVWDPFDVCVCLRNSVSAQGYLLLRTQTAEIFAVFAYVCVLCMSQHTSM